jgi:hypothetical protein
MYFVRRWMPETQLYGEVVRSGFRA